MKRLASIYLAGGCFWGMQAYFSRLRGVFSTEVAYVNGLSDETSYENLKYTDHAEAVLIKYEPKEIRLQEILLHFFRLIDPLSLDKQGNDRGRQYRTGIYYTDVEDVATIWQVYRFVEAKYGEKLKVEVEELKNYVAAEEYHQNYLDKNPGGYCHISLATLKEPLFGKYYTKPEMSLLRERLTPLAFAVTQEDSTEKPHTSEYTELFEHGIYVNVVTGEPLFLSEDKFLAHCGWPSFSRPILTETLNYKSDFLLGYERTEVRTDKDDSHLGHVFGDGPIEMGGNRYCINGASLRFVPYHELDLFGYGEYKVLFDPCIKDKLDASNSEQ